MPIARRRFAGPAEPGLPGGLLDRGGRYFSVSAERVRQRRGKARSNLTIRDGAFADGKRVLPFQSPDGPPGRMTGVLKGDGFSGEWDFRPQAVGTFSLTRVK